MTNYISANELRAFIKDVGSLNQSEFDNACETASRKVEEICDRVFFADTVVSDRKFWPDQPNECRIDDLVSTSGLIVAVDISGDGTFPQTWTLDTDFYLEPVNQRQSGIPWPYTKITSTQTSKWMPIRAYPYIRPTVKVTGKWGWSAVPAAVELATKIIGHYHLAISGAPLGNAGMDGWGPVRVKGVPQTALDELDPFIRDKYATA